MIWCDMLSDVKSILKVEYWIDRMEGQERREGVGRERENDQ